MYEYFEGKIIGSSSTSGCNVTHGGSTPALSEHGILQKCMWARVDFYQDHH